MANKNDIRDLFIMVTIAGAWAAATVYIFSHPGAGTFAAWCGLCATMTGAYHYLNFRDQKEKDADGNS